MTVEHTTLERVLTIAPELTVKVEDRVLIKRLYLSSMEEDTEYTLKVNDVSITIDSQSMTKTEFYEALATDINVELEEEVIATFSNTGIEIDGVDAFTIFTVSSVQPEFVISTKQKRYTGSMLWELLLEDVQLQVTPRNFKDETERAQRYLMAHLLTVTNVNQDEFTPITKDVIEEHVGDVRIKFATDFTKLDAEGTYRMTTYGQTFLEIYKRRWFVFN